MPSSTVDDIKICFATNCLLCLGMMYPEELLHFIWRYRLYDQRDLKTKDGQALQVIHTGLHNQDAGPDFELATIRLDDTVWTGHIEIHRKEDDWSLHRHHLDPTYNATVLHVVWSASEKVHRRADETTMPTLILKDYVNEQMIEKYESLRKSQKEIACENHLKQVPSVIKQSWLERLTIERLEERYTRCQYWIAETKQDWERVFLITLSRSFGMKVNAEAFEELMSGLDIRLLFKYSDEPSKISGLLFGLAGFLNADQDDDEMSMLKKEYAHLRELHTLKSMNLERWKFLRMRPYNFPTYRLAQLAALLSTTTYWFERIRMENDLEKIFEEIRLVATDSYWRIHFRFGVKTVPHGTGWSNSFLNHLAINCFVPVLFSYGKFMGDIGLMNRAQQWMTQIPVERNNIVSYYDNWGLGCQNASDSQALLVLKRNYCDMKRCLDCHIGLAILKA